MFKLTIIEFVLIMLLIIIYNRFVIYKGDFKFTLFLNLVLIILNFYVVRFFYRNILIKYI
jgi:hypothetical protein